MSDRVIIIVPAFNEERTIGDVLREVRAVVPQADILVVNDGSGDRTADVAKRAGAKVISLPYNLGYGVALQTGFKFAYKYRYDYAVQMDGDGQHSPSSIPSLLDVLRGGPADSAVGEAGIPASEQDGHILRD
ncbi:MAG: glycosyltransferase family 2 protein, partial [Planctomycetota bacterium]